MITIIRSAAIAPGKAGDAIAFAKMITQYIEEKFGVKLQIIMPVGGNPYRIAWLGQYENLAAWETFTHKAAADAEYMTLTSKNAATFLPGSIHDDIWRWL
jgi:hypothetical protein